MLTFILILLLIAAIFGVLGAVLKFALAATLVMILTITLIVWIGMWYLRHRMREWQLEMERRADVEYRRRQAYEIRHLRNEADGERPEGRPRELTDGDSS